MILMMIKTSHLERPQEKGADNALLQLFKVQVLLVQKKGWPLSSKTLYGLSVHEERKATRAIITRSSIPRTL